MGNHKRIQWVDIAKGYGVLAVMTTHMWEGEGPVMIWLYTFHLPIFFFLSGYVFCYTDHMLDFVKRKCKSLLLPYFLFGIPMVAFQVIYNPFNEPFTKEYILNFIRRFLLQQRIFTLWYMACLFWLNLIFYIMVRILKDNWKLLCVTIISMIACMVYYHLGGKAWFWNIDTCFAAMPFFFAGYWCRNRSACVETFLAKWDKLVFLIAVVVNFGGHWLNMRITGESLQMYENRYGLVPVVYLSAFGGIVAVILISRWIAVSCVEYVGRNSLVYYTWHQTIMQPLARDLLYAVLGATGVAAMSIHWARFIMLIIVIILSTICNMMFLYGKNLGVRMRKRISTR